MESETPYKARGEMLAAISTELVQLHRQYYGKGPTKAKTHLVDDTVMCVLEGGFTIVERTLIDSGQASAVQEIRRTFQDAMTERFVSAVEEQTGRKVRAYMSQVHTDPDIAVELFLLEPASGGLASEHEPEYPADE